MHTGANTAYSVHAIFVLQLCACLFAIRVRAQSAPQALASQGDTNASARAYKHTVDDDDVVYTQHGRQIILVASLMCFVLGWPPLFSPHSSYACTQKRFLHGLIIGLVSTQQLSHDRIIADTRVHNIANTPKAAACYNNPGSI